MSAKKDINRIRELILGTVIEDIEEKFEILSTKLDNLKEEQKTFQKKVLKKQNALLDDIELHMQKQKDFSKSLQHQGQAIELYREDVELKLQKTVEKSHDELKTLKTELKMHIESKLNSIHKVKVSHKDLSEMFLALSEELSDVDKDETKHHAK